VAVNIAMAGESVLIAGPRPPIPDPVTADVVGRIEELPPGTMVITGWAKGIDRTAENAARRRGLPTDSWRVTAVHERRTDTGVWWDVFVIHRVTEDAAGRSSWTMPARWPYDPQDSDSRRRAFGRAAYWRNARMVEACGWCEVWWDSISRGTGNTRTLAIKAGKLRADRRFERAA
jgi:hypothetical protein